MIRIGLVGAEATPRARQLSRLPGATAMAEAGPADALIWTAPATRAMPYPSGPVNVADLAFWPGGVAGPVRRAAWRRAQAEACRGADAALAGSEAERGFWSAEFARAGIGTPILVLPPAPETLGAPSKPGMVVAVLEQAPSHAVLEQLEAAAAWAAQHEGRLQVVLTPAGAAGLAASKRLRHGPAPVVVLGALTEAEPGILLDARDDTVEERVRTPPAVHAARASGWPVVSFAPGLPPDIADALDRALPEPMGSQPEGAFMAWLAEAVACKELAYTLLPPGPPGQVLVLSDEHDNLIDIRIHRPFGALHRAGGIAGYAVLRAGKIVFSTRAMGRDDPDPAFDAVWVHRSASRRLQLFLQLLDRPFGYDIDDNLLAVPEYRERFGRGPLETVRALIRQAAVLSASTGPLVTLLQNASGVRLADRAVITPNLALEQPVAIQAGLPRAVVWVSSDTPALTGTREAVERAVRDFCAAHRLRLVCMGAAPSPLLRDAGFPLEHVGILPHGAYLEYLRSLSPAILVCPLEAAAAAGTQDFIDGKSDVKMLDAAAAGLLGVYSRAKPYTGTDLGPHILCDNTYEGWLDGLEQAYRCCGQPGPAPVFPPGRVVNEAGLLPFAHALARLRLSTPLYWSEVRATLEYAAQLRDRFIDEADFDAGYYLESHPDVRSAVRDGHIASAYDHYQSSGHSEGRSARTLSEAPEPEEPWWAGMLQAIDRLERVTEARELVIERLQQEQAARRALR